MAWKVGFADGFFAEYEALSKAVQDDVPLGAGRKSGTGQARFYRRPIATADARHEAHLERSGS